MTYINDPRPHDRFGDSPARNWNDFTYARMAWLYGAERACSATRGTDEATNADLAAWQALGRRKAAA